MVQPARDPRDELYEAYLAVPPHQRAEIVRGIELDLAALWSPPRTA